MSADPDHASTVDFGAALVERLHAVFGELVSIEQLEQVSAGASKDIWRVEVRLASGLRHRLVLRRDQPTDPDPDLMAQEAAVLRAAHAQGVLVPQVIDTGDSTAGLGSPYILMTHVDGETIPRKILRESEYADARSLLAYRLGEQIAAVHRIPTDSVPGIPMRDEVAHWEEAYRASGSLSPAMELAWRWLRANRPAKRPDVVVHGDFRHGNIIVGRQGLTGILDWELMHIGDPLEDLGWMCVKAWRYGDAPHVGGFGEVSDLLDGYAAVAGWRPDEQDVLWWEIYGTVRWGTMCRTQADRHLSGAEESLELALIGRRFAENEHDALLALGLKKPQRMPNPLEAMSVIDDPVFGQPTASQLLFAIATQLESGDYRDRLTKHAIDVVHRELLLGDELREQYAAVLAEVGAISEQDLAEQIRDGAVDITDEVLEAVRFGVNARLAVWNPKYLASPS